MQLTQVVTSYGGSFSCGYTTYCSYWSQVDKPINKYEAFLDALCGEREYQKEVIRVTLRYLIGRQYNNLKELAEENYHQKLVLHERYGTLEDFYKHLQLPDKISCTIDLATATGKSYLFYGIARIQVKD